MFSLISDPILSLIYPQYCRVCGQHVEKASNGAACSECWNSTTVFGDLDPLCAKCGVLLVGRAAEVFSTCKRCDEHHYDDARAAGSYEKALSASVLHLKNTPSVPSRVRDLLIEAFDRIEGQANFTVLPVPLSKRRILERGFNQAALLARVVAKHAKLSLDEHSLIRKRDTPMHRAAMDEKARDATVRNVFAVVRPSLVKGRDFLLVDDVMTSGATVSYCAKALKKNGAARVSVLTLARVA